MNYIKNIIKKSKMVEFLLKRLIGSHHLVVLKTYKIQLIVVLNNN